MKEVTNVSESSMTFDIRISEGEPKTMIQWHRLGPELVHAYPIIRIGARPGDRWEWTNYDVSGSKMIYRYQYHRCVLHNGVRCAKIETGLFSESGQQALKTVDWYAEGIGLIKQSEYVSLSSRMELMHTKHRVISE